MSENKFQAEPGQVDFTNIRWAPVINCVVKFQDKILILQRSEKLNFYPGYWNGVSGFLDDDKDLETKVKTELQEELGLDESKIINIKLGEIFDQEAPKYNKTWIVHPILVEVNTDRLKLDWEAQNYKWIYIGDANKLKLLPGFEIVLKKISMLI